MTVARKPEKLAVVSKCPDCGAPIYGPRTLVFEEVDSEKRLGGEGPRIIYTCKCAQNPARHWVTPSYYPGQVYGGAPVYGGATGTAAPPPLFPGVITVGDVAVGPDNNSVTNWDASQWHARAVGVSQT